jgi:hypothetical protein
MEFVGILKQIAFSDLRDIDHVGELLGATKVSISPGWAYIGDRHILSSVDVTLDSAPEALRKPYFGYGISIMNPLETRYGEVRYDDPRIATINFGRIDLICGCIDDALLVSAFSKPVGHTLSNPPDEVTDIYQAGTGPGYTNKLLVDHGINVMSSARTPCIGNNVQIIQEKSNKAD